MTKYKASTLNRYGAAPFQSTQLLLVSEINVIAKFYSAVNRETRSQKAI